MNRVIEEHPHCLVPPDDACLAEGLRRIDPGRYRFVYLGTDFVRGAELQNRMTRLGMEIQHTGQLLAETARDLKHDYTRMVGELEQRNPKPEWWATSVSGQVPYSSFSFINICWLFMVQRLVHATPSRPYFIVVESPALEEALTTAFKSASGPILLLQRPFWKRVLKELAILKRVIHSRCRIVSIWVKRKIQAGSVPPALRDKRFSRPVAVIRSWVTDPSVSNCKYHESFFQGLPEFLKGNGYDVVTLFDPVSHDLIPKARQLQSGRDENLILCDQLLSPWDYLRLFWQTFRSSRWSVDDARIRGMDVSPMVRWELRMDHVSGARFYSNVQWHVLSRLAKRRWPIIAIYFPYENQPWEQYFCYSIRSHFPGVWSAGYQHSTVSDLYLSYYRPLGQSGRVPYPDTVLCNGPASREIFEGIGHSDIRTCYPIRYAYLKDVLDQPIPPARKNIFLVSPPIGVADALEVIVRAEKLFRTADCAVWVKLHPCLDRAGLVRRLERLNFSWPRHFCFVDKPLAELLPSCRALLSTNSTTLAEALAYVCVPVHIAPSSILDLNIIGDPSFYLDLQAEEDYPEFLGRLPDIEARVRRQGRDYVRRLFDYTAPMEAFLPRP